MTPPRILDPRNYIGILSAVQTDRGVEWAWFIQQCRAEWVAVIGATPMFPDPIPVRL